jgi:type I restriction enzyme S subunit
MNKIGKKRLGDIVNFKRGYDLPIYKREKGRYPIISSSGITGHHSEFKAQGEGLVTGRYGTLGKCYYINGKYWPHNTALYATDFKGNYPKYVYFLMQCMGNLKTADKSTVPGINRNDLHELTVPYVQAEKQKPIADFLFELEAKIDLNNRINRELEAMAKLIYDYWFVQFDFPDAEGKPYKSSGGKMVYSEVLKREVPEGWEVKELGEIVKLVKDTILPQNISSTTPYIGLEHIPRKSFILSSWETAEKVNSTKSLFQKNDILFGKIRPYFHKVGVALFDGITSTDTIVLRSKRENLHGIILQTVFSDNFISVATQSSTGTKMPRANWNVLKKYGTICPPKHIRLRFEKINENFFAKIENLVSQNQKLTELRDWLLPMLMNGQVRLQDMQKKKIQDRL